MDLPRKSLIIDSSLLKFNFWTNTTISSLDFFDGVRAIDSFLGRSLLFLEVEFCDSELAFDTKRQFDFKIEFEFFTLIRFFTWRWFDYTGSNRINCLLIVSWCYVSWA